MTSRQPYQDYQKNFQNGMNVSLENEMLRQDPYIAHEMFTPPLPIYYPEIPPQTTKTPPPKFVPPINGMQKYIGYEEHYAYMQEAQMIPHLQQMDYNFQYGMQYPSRTQQPIYRPAPNPAANAYVPQEITKTIQKPTEFNKNQIKIKNIPEFVPKSNINNPKEGELIQVQVYQSVFNSEKDKLKFGLSGLVKQVQDESNQMLYSLDLRNIGIQLENEGLSTKFVSPFAKQQNMINDLPNFSLPSCYAQLKPSLRNSHFQKFTEETLFYIFYFFPKDYLQTLAAEELQVFNSDITKIGDFVSLTKGGTRTIQSGIFLNGKLFLASSHQVTSQVLKRYRLEGHLPSENFEFNCYNQISPYYKSINSILFIQVFTIPLASKSLQINLN